MQITYSLTVLFLFTMPIYSLNLESVLEFPQNLGYIKKKNESNKAFHQI